MLGSPGPLTEVGRGEGSAARCLRGRLPRPQGPPHLVPEVRLRTVLPLLKHVRQLVQAAVVEVKHLVLALPAGHHQLAARAGLVAERPSQGQERRDEYVHTGFYVQA